MKAHKKGAFMQTLHCEKCRLLFNDALQGELSPELQESFVAHLAECKECAFLYEDFKKLSCIIADTPIAPIPDNFQLDIHAVTISNKRVKSQKATKQWLSIAAVFLIFVSTYVVLENNDLSNTKEENLPYVEEDFTAMDEDSFGAVECPQRSELKGLSCELFEEALSDLEFVTEIENANLGFGYELLQYNQDEDGSTTFVIYFYEDESRTVKTTEPSLDVLSLSNVRSFHWKKSE
jgi:hypothetical protein